MENNPLALLNNSNAEIKKLQRPIKVLGIDLGTTNSTVAEIKWNPSDGSEPEVNCLDIKQETVDGDSFHTLVPSIVAINNNKIIVGEGAKRLRARCQEFGLEKDKDIFYECKNDIGTNKTYHRAPEGFGSPAEIGGHILEFLKRAVLDKENIEIDKIVVTVPASFQVAQRKDTIFSAELADIEMAGGNLLDEPVAAFLSYLFDHTTEMLPKLKKPQKILVFDFGGGTCDVAIFQLEASNKTGQIQISPLSVSRYHRLGGGDIDAAILYEVLLPQLIKQNDMDCFDLDFTEKKKYIEPALLSIAEMLKIKLCKEIMKLHNHDKYDDADKSKIVSKLSGVHECELKDKKLKLKAPQLTAEQFEKIMEDFLDTDLLYMQETEYRITNSIFAPIEDAMERGNYSKDEINLCLMVGGSSLIPQVIFAIDEYFDHAEILMCPSDEKTQTAIATGAAYNALALAIYGKPLVQMICHDKISIRTATGDMELIPKGVLLPQPSYDGYLKNTSLAVPDSTMTGTVKLKIELIAGDNDESRILFSEIWQIPGPVNAGDPLCLEYQYDENQLLNLRLKLPDQPEKTCTFEIQNPLTNVVNPHTDRMKINEMEAELRKNKKLSKEDKITSLIELARLYSDLNQHEKAISYLKNVLKEKVGGDARIVNLMGLYYSSLGDIKKSLQMYRKATELLPGESVYCFNLAFALQVQGLYEESIEAIEKAITLNKNGESYVLRAQLAEKTGDADGCKKYLQMAFSHFGSLPSLYKFQLSWYKSAAHMAGDDTRIKDVIKEEERRRNDNSNKPTISDGLLPDMISTIVKVDK